MSKRRGGFSHGSIDPEKHREISSRGGKNAAARHKWSQEEAKEAGRKGGLATAKRKQETSGA
jgi:general stress protein YciG